MITNFLMRQSMCILVEKEMSSLHFILFLFLFSVLSNTNAEEIHGRKCRCADATCEETPMGKHCVVKHLTKLLNLTNGIDGCSYVGSVPKHLLQTRFAYDKKGEKYVRVNKPPKEQWAFNAFFVCNENKIIAKMVRVKYGCEDDSIVEKEIKDLEYQKENDKKYRPYIHRRILDGKKPGYYPGTSFG